MELSVKNFLEKGIAFPGGIKTGDSLDLNKLFRLESQFSKKGITIEKAFKRLKKRTPPEYFNKILIAQTEAQSFAINAFPPYKMLLPDVLMDDWLSIIGPHQQRKRDHSLHQPLTAYIVSELLGGGRGEKNGLMLPSGNSLLTECARIFIEEPGTKYLRDYFERLYPKGIPQNKEIREMWARSVFYHTAIIAALFHDIGYPWQYIGKIGGCLDLVNSDSHGTYDSKGRILFDSIKDRLLVYPFYGYSSTPIVCPTMAWENETIDLVRDAYYNTHGFPGALAFMSLNDVARKFCGTLSMNQAECRFIQDWAAVGIMMHDMSRQYYGKHERPDHPRYRLAIEIDPLSCIIAFADVLEEFGRPLAEFNPCTADKKAVEASFSYPCNKTIVECKGSELLITYDYKSVGDKVRNEQWRKKEIESYFHSPSGFIDMSAIGINRVSCAVEYSPG